MLAVPVMNGIVVGFPLFPLDQGTPSLKLDCETAFGIRPGVRVAPVKRHGFLLKAYVHASFATPGLECLQAMALGGFESLHEQSSRSATTRLARERESRRAEKE